MKFAYIAAALFSLAYASPVAVEAPVEDELISFEQREAAELMTAFDDVLATIEERTFDFDDEFDEEETEIEARSTGSVLNALKKVHAEIGAVNKQLGKFGDKQKPSNSEAIDVEKASAKLTSAVQSSTKKTEATKKFSKSGSKKIFDYIKHSLEPATIKSLENFIKHKPGFAAAGYSGTVKSRLESLKGLVAKQGSALLSKAPKKYKGPGKKINDAIQAKFSQAIKAY